VWVVAERVPELRAVLADTVCDPPLRIPTEFERRERTRESALVELVRSRLSGLGPTTADALAAPLGLGAGDVEAALLALESEGYVMRGRITPGATDDEWCERHLLARIHRYTVKRLRREIEPVEARDYLRFLFEWQRVAPGTQVAGPDALTHVVAQLEGCDAPASAWETNILPARVADYDIAWLDELCRAGRVAWTRPMRRAAGAAPVRATPIALVMRRNVAAWNALQRRAVGEQPALSSRAQALAEFLEAHGASFFDEMAHGTRLLRAEVEDALGELVAAGRATADSFAGLRALLVPESKRTGRRARRRALFGIEDAGRWSLIRRNTSDEGGTLAPEHLEHVARTLLRRYGVVCWRVLERERDALPPWRELLRVYHRLEARGEIRGGRFIQGLSGEQFALPEAIAPLRRKRQSPSDGTLVCVSGADPLNLAGIVVAGAKVPAVVGARVLHRDGVPVAALVAGEMQLLAEVDPREQWAMKLALLGREAQPIE
jgi:ATP-dependent Lhr-like helicase